MNITVQQGGIQAIDAEAIIVNLFQGVTEPAGATGVVNKALDGAIGELIAGGDLRGKTGANGGPVPACGPASPPGDRGWVGRPG